MSFAFANWIASDDPEERYREFAALWRVHCGGDVTQTCQEATATMVKLCPELQRVRGTVKMVGALDGDTRPWPHWWCVTEDGSIVDPTRSQFPCPELEYEPLDEARGEPTGKCPNCGGLCYEGRYLCSTKCEREYLAYIQGSVG